MVVLLSNARLRVRVHAHPFERDEYDQPITPAESPPWRGPYEGAADERDGENLAGEDPLWSIYLPTEAWPIEEDDEVGDVDTGRLWVVRSARLVTLLGYPDVDHVAVVGVLDPPDRP